MQVAVIVLNLVDVTTAGHCANAVDFTRHWQDALGIVGSGEPALVNLLDLCSVLHLACRGASLGKCREQETQEQCDDRHYDEQFDEGESLVVVAVLHVSISHVRRWVIAMRVETNY